MQLCNTYEPECCKLQVSRVAGFPCPLSQWNRGRKYGFWAFQRCLSFQHHPYLLHRGAINTQHITPFNFLFDCYFIRVFCLVFFGVFLFFCPGCTESSVSWQNFLSAQLNPLLPLSCFRKSPQSQMTRGGKETFTVMWEIPSQEKRDQRGQA